MAFTVEDGSGLSNANAYVTSDFFKAYHKDRGTDISAFAGSDIQKAIVRASDYIDRKNRARFIGIRLKDPNTQRMEWPRTNASYSDGSSVLGVPTEIEEATAEYALRALSAALAPDPVYDERNQKVTDKFEKTDVLEERTSYQSSGVTFSFRKYPEVDALLRELVLSGREILRN